MPLCMKCRKLRVGAYFWVSIERYRETHLEAEVSHGLCDGCLEEQYPENPRNGIDWRLSLCCRVSNGCALLASGGKTAYIYERCTPLLPY